MKKYCRFIGVLAMAWSVHWTMAANLPFSAHAVTLDLDATDVRTVLKMLADEAGLNLVLSEQVQGQVSLQLQASEALEQFTHAFGALRELAVQRTQQEPPQARLVVHRDDRHVARPLAVRRRPDAQRGRSHDSARPSHLTGRFATRPRVGGEAGLKGGGWGGWVEGA